MKEPRGDRPPNDEDLPRTPATLPALLRRSRDHLARHEPDQALAAFDAALRLAPADADALAGRATALFHLDQHGRWRGRPPS
ncbi:MAG TPA: hypothetical protein VEL76_17145 [Gemmataceae bacterium]|nr:hypothetical protein [Gemmataceae bacterium]